MLHCICNEQKDFHRNIISVMQHSYIIKFGLKKAWCNEFIIHDDRVVRWSTACAVDLDIVQYYKDIVMNRKQSYECKPKLLKVAIKKKYIEDSKSCTGCR